MGNTERHAVESRRWAERKQAEVIEGFAGFLETVLGVPVRIGVVFEKGDFAVLMHTPIWLEGLRAYTYDMHVVPGIHMRRGKRRMHRNHHKMQKETVAKVRAACGEYDFQGYAKTEMVPWRDANAVKVGIHARIPL